MAWIRGNHERSTARTPRPAIVFDMVCPVTPRADGAVMRVCVEGCIHTLYVLYDAPTTIHSVAQSSDASSTVGSSPRPEGGCVDHSTYLALRAYCSTLPASQKTPCEVARGTPRACSRPTWKRMVAPGALCWVARSAMLSRSSGRRSTPQLGQCVLQSQAVRPSNRCLPARHLPLDRRPAACSRTMRRPGFRIDIRLRSARRHWSVRLGAVGNRWFITPQAYPPEVQRDTSRPGPSPSDRAAGKRLLIGIVILPAPEGTDMPGAELRGPTARLRVVERRPGISIMSRCTANDSPLDGIADKAMLLVFS